MDDNTANISFTVEHGDLHDIKPVVDKLVQRTRRQDRSRPTTATWRKSASSASACAPTPASPSGCSRRWPTRRSTSRTSPPEIKISCIIDKEDGPKALQIVHDAFELEKRVVENTQRRPEDEIAKHDNRDESQNRNKGLILNNLTMLILAMMPVRTFLLRLRIFVISAPFTIIRGALRLSTRSNLPALSASGDCFGLRGIFWFCLFGSLSCWDHVRSICAFPRMIGPRLIIIRLLVSRVVDGDTIHVRKDGSSGETIIRLLGIDAPEHHDPVDQSSGSLGRAVQNLSDRQDSRKNRFASAGNDRKLRDRYDRLLAYIYLGDSDCINLDLCAMGKRTRIAVSSIPIVRNSNKPRPKREPRNADSGRM